MKNLRLLKLKAGIFTLKLQGNDTLETFAKKYKLSEVIPVKNMIKLKDLKIKQEYYTTNSNSCRLVCDLKETYGKENNCGGREGCSKCILNTQNHKVLKLLDKELKTINGG